MALGLLSWSLPPAMAQSAAPLVVMSGVATPMPAAPLAYVSNEKSGTISIIDTATDQVLGEIRAGSKPRGAAVSADGRQLYVSDQPANALLLVDLATELGALL